jgi:hypothetical protein
MKLQAFPAALVLLCLAFLTACGSIGVPSEPALTVLSQPLVPNGSLCGAFTDANGDVIEAIGIGKDVHEYIVPAGASQLQLGVVDDYYADNVGQGYSVPVDSATVSVPPTAMPWISTPGGLNQNYPFVGGDGTAPVVAISSLTPGTAVTVGPTTGSMQLDPSLPVNDAGGLLSDLAIFSNGRFPNYYMTGISYPLSESFPLAVSVSVAGTPIPNVPVSVHVAGADTFDAATTTDSTGVAAFTYQPANLGIHTVSFQASPKGAAPLTGQPYSISIVSASQFASQPPQGTLSVTPGTMPSSAGASQTYLISALGTNNQPITGPPLTIHLLGADNLTANVTTDSSGDAIYTYTKVNAGNSVLVAITTIDGLPVYSNVISQ